MSGGHATQPNGGQRYASARKSRNVSPEKLAELRLVVTGSGNGQRDPDEAARLVEIKANIASRNSSSQADAKARSRW